MLRDGPAIFLDFVTSLFLQRFRSPKITALRGRRWLAPNLGGLGQSDMTVHNTFKLLKSSKNLVVVVSGQIRTDHMMLTH